MKIKATILGVLGAAALALTACGGNTTPESPQTADPGTPSSPSTDSDGKVDADGNPEIKPITIGAATIQSHPALDAAYEGFVEGLANAGYIEGENLVIDLQNANGDQQTLTNIANNFASSDADLFYAIATPTAQALATVVTDRPIVFAAVTDPVEAGLVASWEAPDANVTGVSDANPMLDQLQLIQEVLPDLTSVGIVYASGEVNSEVQVREAEEAGAELGIEILTATVTNTSEVAQAAESIKPDAFLVTTDNTVVSGVESLIQVAENNQIAVFASDESTMERGAAAGMSVSYPQQGRDAAAVALELLEGTPASEIPVATQENFDLFVNESAAAAQGIELPADLIERAAKKF